jgi:hypothetical protein
LAEVQASADKWRTALAALAGIVTGSVLLKGTDDITALTAGSRWMFGTLIAVGLGGVLGGLWQAATAAFGLPAPTTLDELRTRHGSLQGYDYAAATRATNQLLWARRLVAAGLVALATAAGTAWWAPRTATEPALVAVVVDGEPVCGEIIESTDGRFVLHVLDSTRVIEVALGDLERIDVVTAC